jgi:hypothetical protein
MNHSAISKEDRPVTGFGTDNPFNLSKMGYANPAANDRGIPSAMKSRPRIPRTPDGLSHEDYMRSQNQQELNQMVMYQQQQQHPPNNPHNQPSQFYKQSIHEEYKLDNQHPSANLSQGLDPNNNQQSSKL